MLRFPIILKLVLFLCLASIYGAGYAGKNRLVAAKGLKVFPKREFVLANDTLLKSNDALSPLDDVVTILEPPTTFKMRNVLSVVSLTSLFLTWYVLSAGRKIILRFCFFLMQ